MPTKKDKELKINVSKLYETLEAQADFNSINEKYRSDVFIGTFLDIQEFSGKFGTTYRYTFTTDNGDKWSLLSNASILQKIIPEIPTGTKCEVYKNEKGHWRIMPYLK